MLPQSSFLQCNGSPHERNVASTQEPAPEDRPQKGRLDSLDFNQIKGQDFVARYGGEGFVIVLPQTLTAHAAAVAENLRKKVEAARVKRVTNNDIVGNITVSASVVGWDAGELANDLFARTDSALYDAKRGGRNRVVIAEHPQQSAASTPSPRCWRFNE